MKIIESGKFDFKGKTKMKYLVELENGKRYTTVFNSSICPKDAIKEMENEFNEKML